MLGRLGQALARIATATWGLRVVPAAAVSRLAQAAGAGGGELPHGHTMAARVLQRAGLCERGEPLARLARGVRAPGDVEVVEDCPRGDRGAVVGAVASGALYCGEHELVGWRLRSAGARAGLRSVHVASCGRGAETRRRHALSRAGAAPNAALGDNRQASRVSDSVPGPGC
jgi:hypothetical protein